MKNFHQNYFTICLSISSYSQIPIDEFQVEIFNIQKSAENLSLRFKVIAFNFLLLVISSNDWKPIYPTQSICIQEPSFSENRWWANDGPQLMGPGLRITSFTIQPTPHALSTPSYLQLLVCLAEKFLWLFRSKLLTRKQRQSKRVFNCSGRG